MKNPIPLVCALALVLAALTGAVSGAVSAKLACEPLTTATALTPDAPTFGVQSPTVFTEVHAAGPITGVGGLNVSGEILLGDTPGAANGTLIRIDDTAQQVGLGNYNGSIELIVDAAAGLLNANTLSLIAKRYVAKQTASDELGGTHPAGIFTNIGATGAITMTLNTAHAGDNYCFYVGAAQALNIDPATGDQIVALTNAAGDKITNNTPGSSVCLVAADTTNWMPIGTVGTWSDAN